MTTASPPTIADGRERDRLILQQTWAPPAGPLRWFKEVNAQVIGSAVHHHGLIFFVLGGIEALLIRIQLARPENRFLNPDLYDQIFTLHGSTMMFLFAVPVMQGSRYISCRCSLERAT